MPHTTAPDLTAITDRLAQWRHLKGHTTKGTWSQPEESLYGILRDEKGQAVCVFNRLHEDLGYGDATFVAHAHNTTIEDDVQTLLDYIAQQEKRSTLCP